MFSKATQEVLDLQVRKQFDVKQPFKVIQGHVFWD